MTTTLTRHKIVEYTHLTSISVKTNNLIMSQKSLTTLLYESRTFLDILILNGLLRYLNFKQNQQYLNVEKN